MFSSFSRDEAFEVHNDPARVWVLSCSCLWSRLSPFPRGPTARSAGLRCVGPWLLVFGFWFLVFGPPLTQSTAQPNCSLPQSARFRVALFPCFRFRVSRANTPRNPARHGSLRCASPSILSTPSRQRHRHRHRRNQHLARPSNAARQLQSAVCSSTRQGTRKGSHHGAACKRLRPKTSLASPCHERPRGDGLVQRTRYSVPEINATTSQL